MKNGHVVWLSSLIHKLALNGISKIDIENEVNIPYCYTSYKDRTNNKKNSPIPNFEQFSNGYEMQNVTLKRLQILEKIVYELSSVHLKSLKDNVSSIQAKVVSLEEEVAKDKPCNFCVDSEVHKLNQISKGIHQAKSTSQFAKQGDHFSFGDDNQQPKHDVLSLTKFPDDGHGYTAILSNKFPGKDSPFQIRKRE